MRHGTGLWFRSQYGLACSAVWHARPPGCLARPTARLGCQALDDSRPIPGEFTRGVQAAYSVRYSPCGRGVKAAVRPPSHWRLEVLEGGRADMLAARVQVLSA